MMSEFSGSDSIWKFLSPPPPTVSGLGFVLGSITRIFTGYICCLGVIY